KEAIIDREQLLKSQELLQLNLLDANLQQEERKLGETFKRSNYWEEIFLQQRSKATWIRLGDDNTKYFCSVIKHRKLVQVVTQLQDSNGNIHDDPEAIAGVFVKFYKEPLGEQGGWRRIASAWFLHNGHRLTTQQQLDLIAPYTRKDVKNAMMSINMNKSPRLDGFGSVFFQKCMEH
uniref:Uncharacterized protein LOC104220502 n=1 Tax=Nicotiana sylvestris TaxID=4096 RepID=A0A1U7VP56_NICSY